MDCEHTKSMTVTPETAGFWQKKKLSEYTVGICLLSTNLSLSTFHRVTVEQEVDCSSTSHRVSGSILALSSPYVKVSSTRC